MIKSPQPVDEDVVDLVGDGDDAAAIVECEPAHDSDGAGQANKEQKKQEEEGNRAPQGMCGVLVLACGFFMVFFAYSAAQNLQTSLAGMTGYISLGIIYVVFAVSSLFAPTAIASAGEKPVLIAGALCYVPFLFANAWPRLALMVPASVLTGIGAGLIWAAQGSALVKLAGTGHRLGLASGIFFVVYQANGVLGNLFTGFFLGSGHDLAVFVTFGIMGIVGAILFLPLRVPSNRELANQNKDKDRDTAANGTAANGTAPQASQTLSLGQKLANSFRIIFSRRMLWMVVPLVFSGTTTAFCMGKFPAIIGRPRLSYVMALLAAVDSVSSFLCGKLSDRIGRIPVLLFGWFALNAANALTVCAATLVRSNDGLALADAADYAALAHHIPPRAQALLWAAAVGFGFYDSTMQTQLYSIFGLVFPDDPAAGFGAYRFVLSVVSGVWFVCSAYVPVMAMGILSSCLSVLFITIIFLVHRHVVPLMPPHTTTCIRSHHKHHQEQQQQQHHQTIIHRRRRPHKYTKHHDEPHEVPLQTLSLTPTPSLSPSPRSSSDTHHSTEAPPTPCTK